MLLDILDNSNYNFHWISIMIDEKSKKFWLENRNKKLYKVHVDLTVHGQFTSRVVPMSIKVLANTEQEAKNIARHVKITNVSVEKVKEEIDFSK